ncbi:MAG: alpha-galactosidase, partial [Lentisphaeria bacterium]
MWSIDKGTGMVRCAVGALGGGYWVVRCGAQALDARRLAWHDGRALDADSGLELKLHADDGTVQLEVTNTSPIPRTVDDLFLRFDHAALEAEDYLEYVHSKWLYEAQSAVKCVGLKTDFVAANPESSLVYLLNKQGSGTSFLFAALPPQQEDYVYFKALHLAPDLRGAFGVEIRSEQGRVLPPGASLRSSRILFDQGEDPLSLLENLGDRYAALRPRPLKSRPVGWNSWDEIGTKVTAPAIEDNQRIAGEAFGDKVRVYIIDDGWQKSWGDWRFTSTFLATGEEFCSRITAAGGVPGIWLAPLYADQSVMEQHPDWFAKMPDGTLVESVNDRYTLGCLDITVPEVERHLFDLYRSLWTMGFRYFKVDFTQMVQRCTGFHDRTVGRGAIIRKTFEVIRRAVGDDSYVLACAPPYE